MNLQLLLTTAVGSALALTTPAVDINSFDDLTAHIPDPEKHQILTEPLALPFDGRLPDFLQTGPFDTAANLNGHVLFRGVDAFSDRSENLSIDTSELNCLAQNIYFEARGESMAGQIAVGLVTMNRVRSNDTWPNTVCEVVQQGNLNGASPSLYNCQFAWYCDGIAERITDQEAWERSVTIASRVLENRVQDFTNGSTNFHTIDSNPSWARRMERTLVIDNHVFLK